MPKFEPQFFKIGDKLLAHKNRLFEVVQYKLDEGKDNKQIIKELKDEFDPTIDIMKEIEVKLLKKEADNIDNMLIEFEALLAKVNQAYNEGVIGEDLYAKARDIYDRVDDPAHIGTYLDELKKLVEEEKEERLQKLGTIKKTPGKEEWKVFTEKGNPMGTYDSEPKAKERIKQMEMFKHMGQDLSQSQVGDEVMVEDEVGEVLVNTDTLIEIKLPDGRIKAIPKIK